MTANENYLLKLLSNNNVTFYIPPYQRNYEWTKEECEIFFNDIRKTEEKNVNDEQAEHFFSSFTYFSIDTTFGQPSKLVLIDGQQRLTTTMLFLIAARNCIKDASLKETIESLYLKNNRVSGNDELKIKLKQVANDSEVFRKLILCNILTPEDKESQIYKNYNFFYQKLKNFNSEKKIQSLIKNGLDHFSIVAIEIQPEKPWENPQEIFESMNSLGKPLSFADLIRNYLLMGLDTKKQEEYYEKYWLGIEKMVKGEISNFIRDYMQAKRNLPSKKANDVNSKELYSDFKIFSLAHINNIEPFFEEIYSYAECYSIVLQMQSSGNERIDELLQSFIILKGTTTRTPLLEIIHLYKKGLINTEDTIDMLEPLFIHFLRRKFVNANIGENKKYPLIVKNLIDISKKPNKRDEMYKMLSSQEYTFRLPNDNEIRSVLLTTDIYHVEWCNFILALIEKYLTKSMPDLKDKKLQIEHILPQKLTPIWEAELGENALEIHEKLVNTIGNLTLIRHNQELSTKSFRDKKEIYENNSGLQIAKSKIINEDHWTEVEIKARTKYLTDIILNNILPIPKSMKFTNNYKITAKRYNFEELGLIGDEIVYIDNPSLKFKIINKDSVEYNGSKIKLSPLVKELKRKSGELSPSGAYSGYEHFSWEGYKLSELMKNDNYSEIIETKKEEIEEDVKPEKIELPLIKEDFTQNLKNDKYEVHVGQMIFSAVNNKGIVSQIKKEESLFIVIFEASNKCIFHFPEAFANNSVVKLDN